MKRRGFLRGLLGGTAVSVAAPALAKGSDTTEGSKPVESPPSDLLYVEDDLVSRLPSFPEISDSPAGVQFNTRKKRIYLNEPKTLDAVVEAAKDFFRKEGASAYSLYPTFQAFSRASGQVLFMRNGWVFDNPSLIQAGLQNHNGQDLDLMLLIGSFDGFGIRYSVDGGKPVTTQWSGPQFFHVVAKNTVAVWTDCPFPSHFRTENLGKGLLYYVPLSRYPMISVYKPLIKDNIQRFEESLGKDLAAAEIKRHQRAWWGYGIS